MTKLESLLTRRQDVNRIKATLKEVFTLSNAVPLTVSVDQQHIRADDPYLQRLLLAALARYEAELDREQLELETDLHEVENLLTIRNRRKVGEYSSAA